MKIVITVPLAICIRCRATAPMRPKTMRINAPEEGQNGFFAVDSGGGIWRVTAADKPQGWIAAPQSSKTNEGFCEKCAQVWVKTTQEFLASTSTKEEEPEPPRPTFAPQPQPKPESIPQRRQTLPIIATTPTAIPQLASIAKAPIPASVPSVPVTTSKGTTEAPIAQQSMIPIAPSSTSTNITASTNIASKTEVPRAAPIQPAVPTAPSTVTRQIISTEPTDKSAIPIPAETETASASIPNLSVALQAPIPSAPVQGSSQTQIQAPLQTTAITPIPSGPVQGPSQAQIQAPVQPEAAPIPTPMTAQMPTNIPSNVTRSTQAPIPTKTEEKTKIETVIPVARPRRVHRFKH